MPDISEQELNRLKNAISELSALNQIAGAINVAMSVDKISQIIIDHCLKKLAAAQGTIFLLDEEEKADQLKTFVRKMDSGIEQIPLRLNLNLTGWIIKNKKILISNQPQTDNRFIDMDFNEIGVKSILAAPLLTRKGLVGVLAIFNKNGDGGFTEEDKRFAGIVATQTSSVIENARLFEREKKLITIEEELNIAQKIQRGFLPKNDYIGIAAEVCGINRPAKEMGGDYFDIVDLGNDRIFISLGDVSGKGVPAALLMANAQAVLRSQLSRMDPQTLPEIAGSLNHLIYQFTTPAEYITGIFGFFDNRSGMLHYINAGHLPPIIVAGDGSCRFYERADLVFGVLPDVSYMPNEIQLISGETAFIYTDGITEAENLDGEQYGQERLCSFLAHARHIDATALRDNLLNELSSFRSGAAQSDDITLLVIRRK